MGLTYNSTGKGAIDSKLFIKRQSENDVVVALAGNPNVGKSTIFNELTGMNQHTGNWPGKTVSNAQGYFSTDKYSYVLVDVPGTYSLYAHSVEEEVARNFICFGEHDAVTVVCDATCLERNLNLVIQITEVCPSVIVCVNLMDEAKRKGIEIDLQSLSKKLGVPVIGTNAKDKKTLNSLKKVMDKKICGDCPTDAFRVKYPDFVEKAIDIISENIKHDTLNNKRWIALKLLSKDKGLIKEICEYNSIDSEDEELQEGLKSAESYLMQNGINAEKAEEIIASAIIKECEKICKNCVHYCKKEYNNFDRKMDRILTSKATGYPIMVATLILILWLTISGANYPSEWLSAIFGKVETYISSALLYLNSPSWLHELIVFGVFRTLSWIVAVMLPPMAIFFPLFTLLEDVGYLPRIAYNLDKPFKCCKACGKQALTMW